MIKSENGDLTVVGNETEIWADMAVVVGGIYDKVTAIYARKGIQDPEAEAEKKVREAVEIGISVIKEDKAGMVTKEQEEMPDLVIPPSADRAVEAFLDFLLDESNGQTS